jgi:hypothetical protein
MILSLENIALFCELLEHGGDVYKVFVGIPTFSHTINVQLKGLIVQSLSVKQTHRNSFL